MKTRHSPINIDSETFRKNAHWLVDQVAAFLESLPTRKVTTGEQPKELKAFLKNDPIPTHGKALEEILKEATGLLFNHSLFNGHPKFWGYITSSPAPGGMLAELLASAVNANVGAYTLSPMATEIEKQTIRWIAQFIGYPDDCGGLFVSGGNMANITALLAARTTKANYNIRKEGLYRQPMTIYCSEGTHTWIQKAADALGFGTENLRWIKLTENHQMDVNSLENQIELDKSNGYFPFIVIATAGSVGLGVVDPLTEISHLCQKHNIWFHVDGAYGAPASAVPEVAAQFKGIELADSIALDPHKWLYSPLEAGCVLVRDPQTLSAAFNFHPEYYNFKGNEKDPVINYLDYGFQNSRGFRALKVWVTLQQIGRQGYVQLIGDDIRLSKKLFDHIKNEEEMEAVSNHLSITTFRYIPKDFLGSETELNELNETILNHIQKGGDAFVSNAVIHGKYCLRACIVNFRTTEQNLEEFVQLILSIGSEIYTTR